jgi:hypothetical protein
MDSCEKSWGVEKLKWNRTTHRMYHEWSQGYWFSTELWQAKDLLARWGGKRMGIHEIESLWKSIEESELIPSPIHLKQSPESPWWMWGMKPHMTGTGTIIPWMGYPPAQVRWKKHLPKPPAIQWCRMLVAQTCRANWHPHFIIVSNVGKPIINHPANHHI